VPPFLTLQEVEKAERKAQKEAKAKEKQDKEDKDKKVGLLLAQPLQHLELTRDWVVIPPGEAEASGHVCQLHG
jgi:hypothetical protein